MFLISTSILLPPWDSLNNDENSLWNLSFRVYQEWTK